MKKCNTCNEIKGREDFFKDKRSPNGLYYHCKSCHAKKVKQYRMLKNPEHYAKKEIFATKDPSKTRICRTCKIEKELSSFKKQGKESLKVGYNCKDCETTRLRDRYFKNHEEEKQKRRLYSIENKEKNKSRMQAWNLKAKFKISESDYREMLDNANKCCEICKKEESQERRLSVDHNHATGVIRGLLCTKCNTSLGLLNTDIGVELLQNAIEYIKRTESYI